MEAKRLVISAVLGSLMTPESNLGVFAGALYCSDLVYISFKKLRVNIRKIPQYFSPLAVRLYIVI